MKDRTRTKFVTSGMRRPGGIVIFGSNYGVVQELVRSCCLRTVLGNHDFALIQTNHND
jgi:hypothetical protein